MLHRSFRPLAFVAAAILSLAATSVSAQSNQGSEAARRERAREDARAGRTTGAAPTSAQQRTRGMAEAPAVAQSAGVPCTVADAVWIGTSGSGATARQAYEVACTGALGYVLISAPAPGQPAVAQDCIAMDTLARRELATNPAATPTRCALPGNANPGQHLQPILAANNRSCTINNVRAVGQAGNLLRYEVGCAEGPGFLVDRPVGASTEAARTVSCLEASAAGIECEYTPRTALVAAVQRTIASQTPACTVSDFRWMGRPTGRNSEFVEVTCGGNAGYVAEVAENGSVTQWVTCGQASGIGGGCQMTNAAVAQTQDAALYTTSAQAASIDCAVERYRRIGIDSGTGREVVELTCGTGRPGVVAFFPIPGRQSQPAQGIDCLRAQARNVPCRLTPIDAVYPTLTQQLQASGNPCAVSAIRVMGRLEQDDLVEVACDAAQRGYVVALPVAQSSGIGQVRRCVDAREIGGGCQLPANRAGDRPRS